MAKHYHHLDPNQSFYVGPRFCDLQPLGFGGGGQVYSAVDVKCDKSVAIKKIGLTSQKSCKVALREVRILRKLQHENIVKIHDVLYLEGDDASHHECVSKVPSVYVVQELLDTDLRNIIASGTLTSEHARLFMYQLLRGIKYLHSANVLHRDLKPDNLLINLEDLVLKIGDFGMARILDPDYSHKGHLTQNVSTRWYRSPEVIFCPSDYTKAIDMWSAGCVFAEMLTGKPLFPGDHDLDQLLLVLEMIPISEVDLCEVEGSIPRKMLKNYKGIPRISLSDVLSGVEPDALDLLQTLLTFSPNDRASAEEAIRHPYLKIYSCASDEPQELDPFHVECEVDNLSPVMLRKLIFNESKAKTVVGEQPQPLSQELSATNDLEDDYKWKLEMLNFSSRDNSDLDSEEELVEKLDLDKTALELTQQSRLPVQNENNEKSESEASEKFEEDSKEHKLLLWEQSMAARGSSKEVQEKGATESDGESSEKSETEDAKTEKDMEGEVTCAITEQDFVSRDDFSEKHISESSQTFDKNVLLKASLSNENAEKQALRMDSPTKKEDSTSDLSEKAIGDKLQKEKQEDISVGEHVEERKVSANIEQSVRRKERENKNFHAMQSTNNKVLYDEEKTLQQHLQKSCQVEDVKESPKNMNVTQTGKDSTSFVSLGLESSVLPSQVALRSNAGVDFLHPLGQERSLSRPVGFDEVLYVDIPRNPSSLSGSPRSPLRDGDKPSPVQSLRPRGSNSPREKSVRPKKQDWFYLHKGSSN